MINFYRKVIPWVQVLSSCKIFWTVPTLQDNQKAPTIWVSGPTANQPDYTQTPEYIKQTKDWACIHPARFDYQQCTNFPEQASFNVIDCRGQQILHKDGIVLEELEFYAEHLMNMGVLLIVADFSDLLRYLNLLETGQAQTLKL